MDTYEIREDGTLWHQAYDTENRSDLNAEGIMAICEIMTPVNHRWERDTMTGEVRFYTTVLKGKSYDWIEFSAYFVGGELKQLETIEKGLDLI